jgi:hypothetical protein
MAMLIWCAKAFCHSFADVLYKQLVGCMVGEIVFHINTEIHKHLLHYTFIENDSAQDYLIIFN